MKNIYKISALLCASLFVFSACVEENLEQPYKPAEVGDEITFGARAGFEDADPATKTVYGTPYTDETTNKTFHPIEWVDGDLIEIYSPEAGGINPCCYKITPVDVANPAQGKDYATLTRNNPEGSLQWGEGYTAVIDGKTVEGVHDFYAMYPSSDTFKESSDAVLKAGVKMDKAVVNGVVPDVQIPAEVVEPAEGSKDWVVKPNMDYAYMVAHNVGNRTNGLIPLSFYPIVTAVEIQMFFETKSNETVNGEVINYDDNISITHVRVESDAMITGSFTCDLKKWEDKTKYPTCTGSAVAGYANCITVPVWYDKTPNDNNLSYEPVVVGDGGKLTFTVFLLPDSGETDVLGSLKVSVSTNGGSAYVGKDLPGITIKKNLKNRIINLALPLFSDKTKLNVGNWITQLEEQKPNAPIIGLSIPGTGGSFSYASSDVGYAQQSSTMDIDAQWNIGVRAFEIVSDIPYTVSGLTATGNATTSLGVAPVECNRKQMGEWTVYKAIKSLIEKVTTTTDGNENNEFAVAILTYQPYGSVINIFGSSDIRPARNATMYANNLHVLLNTPENESKTDGLKDYLYDKETNPDGPLMLFTPDLTISDVKNKVMLICRINQEGESEAGSFTDAQSILANDPVLLINGCGSAKDKWQRRGYHIGDNPANNIVPYGTDTFSPDTDIEYFIKGSRTGRYNNYVYTYPDDANINIKEANFYYTTNHGTCWFQEWARVVPGEEGTYFEHKAATPYRWKASYDEKLDNVITTFDKAINNEFTGVVVINSLCGYFVNESFNMSYVPFPDSNGSGGSNGDIQGLATELNRDFYQYILGSSLKDSTGPTGIVMMDFVSSDASAGGSYYIPGVIITNNFQ